MTTKERIVEEALTLFSYQGYKGTSVKNIADAVGIKDSSIYKHFKSKREIIDAIVEQMKVRMMQLSEEIGMPQDENDSDVQKEMSLEKLQEMSRKAFLFYLTDDFVSRFWRLAMMEQYQNEEIYQVYYQIFFEQSIEYQTKVFAKMIKQGIFRQADPQVLAISYYSPIFFLLHKYNGRVEEKEEALQILDKLMADFYERCRR